MGVVTGLTAARMIAMEAASIISGAVVGSNLILTRHDGTTINAGAVKGPKGDIGPAGGPGALAATPSTWAIRDASGRMKAADPGAADDVATKAYVDAIINPLEVHQDTGWTPLTLDASVWRPYPGYEVPSYRKINGIVYLGGLLQAVVATAAPQQITVLPAGYRPRARRIMGTKDNSTTFTIDTDRMDILPTGVVQAQHSQPINGWISVEAVYPADA